VTGARHPERVADRQPALLAWLERSDLIESMHLGVLTVVQPDGTILTRAGDIDQLVFGRSVLKPLQAIAALRAGAPLTGAKLAIAAASHEGTADQQALVRTILEFAGMSESALRCPADWPADPDSRRDAPEPSRLAMNCSGKHAAFVLACRIKGWSTDDYLEPTHPLQVLVREVVEEYSGEQVAHVGVDGCGAPVFAVTFTGLAIALASTATTDEGRQVRAAMTEHPSVIDSPDVAQAIRQLGVFAKRGFEGICVVSTSDGLTALVKSIDGSSRPSLQAAVLALAGAGGIDARAAEAFVSATSEPVLGGGMPVGALQFARFS